MYFLSMKIYDRNNYVPLMSEHSGDMSALLKMVENTTEILTRTKRWDKTVIDNNFDKHHMSNAAIKVMNNEIVEFEWSYIDKYSRKIKCYITSNV